MGAHGMINYVDARTSWMDDIVKQAQWQGIAQVTHASSIARNADVPGSTCCAPCFAAPALAAAHTYGRF